VERPTGYTVLLDASVLFPAFISGLLLWIASSKLFRVRWTNQIHDEWVERRLQRYPDLDRAQLERRRQRMIEEFPDSVVTGYEGLIDQIVLPDPKDRHALAAAITCAAHVIVTSDLSHFQEPILSRYSIAAQHPDDFIVDQIDLHSESLQLVSLAIAQHKLSLTQSRPTWKRYFEFMSRDAVLPKTHSAVTIPEMKEQIKTALRGLNQ
jgi:predicted nucleic acid-binding protein